MTSIMNLELREPFTDHPLFRRGECVRRMREKFCLTKYYIKKCKFMQRIWFKKDQTLHAKFRDHKIYKVGQKHKPGENL